MFHMHTMRPFPPHNVSRTLQVLQQDEGLQLACRLYVYKTPG
jgi:hypothetical protein